MTARRSLLAVLAHPDDESFGPGGTLARYSAEGAAVHVAIATDGAAGSVIPGFEERRPELVSIRARELEQAVSVLGATLHRLGYRDSGYIGDAANNNHPEAFINAALPEAVGRVVALIRHIRPTVVITHDEMGGYFHPDHIRCHEVVAAAFIAAGDGTRYPTLGPAPFAPGRLYYTAIPKPWTRYYSLRLRLRGQNPRRAGRNQDIDLTQVGKPLRELHARIDVRAYLKIKEQAAAAHESQGGRGGRFSQNIPSFVRQLLLGTEYFARAVPPAPAGLRENSLFPD